jgi:hypothetical protein
MNREERMEVLERIILDIQEEIEVDSQFIRLLQSHRRRIAEEVDRAYSVDEGEVYKILTDEAFRFKENHYRFKEQAENVWIPSAKALSQSDEVLRVNPKEDSRGETRDKEAK